MKRLLIVTLIGLAVTCLTGCPLSTGTLVFKNESSIRMEFVKWSGTNLARYLAPGESVSTTGIYGTAYISFIYYDAVTQYNYSCIIAEPITIVQNETTVFIFTNTTSLLKQTCDDAIIQ